MEFRYLNYNALINERITLTVWYYDFEQHEIKVVLSKYLPGEDDPKYEYKKLQRYYGGGIVEISTEDNELNIEIDITEIR